VFCVCDRHSQDLDLKNSEDETPLSLAKKQGNDPVVKALKNFGTRPIAIAGYTEAPSATLVERALQVAVEQADDFDENIEPARTCFPDFAYDQGAGSNNRVHVMSKRLLVIARKMMQTSLRGNASLMRQSLLEWKSTMSQCVQPILLLHWQ
jgi:hypothetical protein